MRITIALLVCIVAANIAAFLGDVGFVIIFCTLYLGIIISYMRGKG